MKKKIILDTNTCKVYQEKEGIVLYMQLKNGGWVKNNPYKGDLQGLIGALTLGIDVLAGKVWPSMVVSSPEGDLKPVPQQLGMDIEDDENTTLAFLGDGE